MHIHIQINKDGNDISLTLLVDKTNMEIQTVSLIEERGG